MNVTVYRAAMREYLRQSQAEFLVEYLGYNEDKASVWANRYASAKVSNFPIPSLVLDPPPPPGEKKPRRAKKKPQEQNSSS